MFKGSCVALVTPFRNGSIDEEALIDLVEFHVAQKTAALVPCGSTGESATLSHEEHHRVIEIVVRQARRRVPVIAGAGSNSTAEAVSLVRHAEQVGADAALVIVPYYNKPSQRGIREHFTMVARSSALPLIPYNIPSRTGVNMLPATFLELAGKHSNIVGIKESSGNLDQISEITQALKDRKDFSLLSGDDSLTLPILAAGGKGVISVLANIAPKLMSELCAAFQKGNVKLAQEIHWRIFPLVKALFADTNPVPVKAAMEILGLCSSEVRLPLCPLDQDQRKKLAQELKSCGVKKP